MREFWEKIKLFFKDKLNTIAFILVLLFIIMVALPFDSEILDRFSMAILAIALLIIAYKFYKKHMEMRDVYDNIDSTHQEKKGSSFSKLKDKVERTERYNNIIYGLVFAAIALLILFYVIFK